VGIVKKDALHHEMRILCQRKTRKLVL